MRLRKKPWGDYELENNPNFISNPKDNKGKWQAFFGNNNPIHVEIGSGKGQFLTSMSLLNPEINYIAIERQTNVIVSALKKGREKGVNENIAFFVADVQELLEYFEPKELERLYINFCDPWPNKKKWAKRRLTHKNFLSLYEILFVDGGEIFFKTDNTLLFDFSLNEIADKGWRLHNISLDLHNSEYEGNVKTEYEEKFSGKGMPIYRLEAYYKK
ncbi:MAG: tRNA (guanosine(46)-N7)-methyltransferase TrmB [bacterium]